MTDWRTLRRVGAVAFVLGVAGSLHDKHVRTLAREEILSDRRARRRLR